MASVTKADIPEVSNFMGDFWKIIKKYWLPEDTDAFWEGLMGETDRLYKRYEHGDPANADFARGQLVSFMDYIDKKNKKQRLERV